MNRNDPVFVPSGFDPSGRDHNYPGPLFPVMYVPVDITVMDQSRVDAVNTAIQAYSNQIRPPDVRLLRMKKLHDIHAWHLSSDKRSPCNACGVVTADMLTPDLGEKPFCLCRECFTEWKLSGSIQTFHDSTKSELKRKVEESLAKSDETARKAPRPVNLGTLMLSPDVIDFIDKNRGTRSREEFVSKLITAYPNNAPFVTA